MPRLAFAEAAQHFADLVEQVPDAAWNRPGLGSWTVRELVAHTLRALTTVEQALEPAGPRPVLSGPADYYRVVLGAPDVHAGVAERARADADALGPQPAVTVRAVTTRVLAVVRATPDEAPCSRGDWSLPLIDYLPTRVVELVVHSLDLADALGLAADPPPWPTGLALEVLVDLTDRVPGGRGALLRAVTGRRPLPAGFDVLGDRTAPGEG